MSEPTLSEKLASMGWRHEAIDRTEVTGKRRVYDALGTVVGDFDALEMWKYLEKREAAIAEAALATELLGPDELDELERRMMQGTPS